MVISFVRRAILSALLCSGLDVNPFDLEIPRVTSEELEHDNRLKTGHRAYVIKNFFADKWAAANWTLDYLEKKIPFEWVDYYPENMADLGKKPFLLRFEEAVKKFRQPSSHPRYMQMRISLRGWQRMVKDFQPLPAPDVFWSDEEWIRDCMKNGDGKVDKPAIDNFFTTNQWKFLLIGEHGTSMFLHKDGTAASSWQAQLIGRKKWTLCPNTESRLLGTEIDTFNPDYKKSPQFAKAKCGQVTVNPGELLYYPAYWWHHTYQLETPSIGYTGALVGVEADRDDVGTQRKVHRAFFDDLMQKCAKCWTKESQERKCDDISLKWPGAAPPPMRVVCENYLPKCLELWDKHAQSLHGGKGGRREL